MQFNLKWISIKIKIAAEPPPPPKLGGLKPPLPRGSYLTDATHKKNNINFLTSVTQLRSLRKFNSVMVNLELHYNW